MVMPVTLLVSLVDVQCVGQDSFVHFHQVIVDKCSDLCILLGNDEYQGHLIFSLHWIDNPNHQNFINLSFHLLGVMLIHQLRALAHWSCVGPHQYGVGLDFLKDAIHIFTYPFEYIIEFKGKYQGSLFFQMKVHGMKTGLGVLVSPRLTSLALVGPL